MAQCTSFGSLLGLSATHHAIRIDDYDQQIISSVFQPTIAEFSVLDSEHSFHQDSIAARFIIPRQPKHIAFRRFRIFNAESVEQAWLLAGDRIIGEIGRRKEQHLAEKLVDCLVGRSPTTSPRSGNSSVMGLPNPRIWLPSMECQDYSVVVFTTDTNRNEFWQRKVQVKYQSLAVPAHVESLVKETVAKTPVAVPEFRLLNWKGTDVYEIAEGSPFH